MDIRQQDQSTFGVPVNGQSAIVNRPLGNRQSPRIIPFRPSIQPVGFKMPDFRDERLFPRR
jgi:hypothetical protein